MALRRKTKAYVKKGPVNYTTLICEKCSKTEVKVEDTVIAVTCHLCTVKMGPAIPKVAAKVQEGPKKPKGWKFMKQFVDADGNVFQKGEEKPELKGTLPVTVIEAKEKKSTFQREQEKAAKEAKIVAKFKKKQDKLKKLEEKAEAKAAQRLKDATDGS